MSKCFYVACALIKRRAVSCAVCNLQIIHSWQFTKLHVQEMLVARLLSSFPLSKFHKHNRPWCLAVQRIKTLKCTGGILSAWLGYILKRTAEAMVFLCNGVKSFLCLQRWLSWELQAFSCYRSFRRCYVGLCSESYKPPCYTSVCWMFSWVDQYF